MAYRYYSKISAGIGVLTASLMVTVALGWASQASAHISLEQGGSYMSRDGDGALKDGPCGKAGSTRGTAHVYTVEAGSTLHIKLIETIPHPSYFRWAFDQDGQDGFKDPVSMIPIDKTRPCPYQGSPNDHCMADDFYNTPEVLPNMDNLNPHINSASGTPYEWDVKLPDVTCDNCTLQVIQVMEDPAFHGPFDGSADIYHQCIDLVLVPKGTPTGGTGGTIEVGGAGGETGGASGVNGGVAGTVGGVGTGIDNAGSSGGVNPGGPGGAGSGVGAGGSGDISFP
ncbi:MAG TPA: SCE4755 family polysaccharide monooxygenase-like protein, partial [Polyangiales bacterium]|nr:SCE4755 family polysaccharide monooxygenase-like protein [Polyangiales bacterium]